MSTNIFGTYRIPPERASLDQLLDIGSEMKKIHEVTIDEDYMACLQKNLFFCGDVTELKLKPEWVALTGDEQKLLICSMGESIALASTMFSDCGSFVLHDNDVLQYLRDRFFQRCAAHKPSGYSVLSPLMDSISSEAYEVMNREGTHHSIYFLHAADGSVYAKAFGASQKAIEYLRTVGERFVYTDATNMSISDFSPEAAEQYAKLKTEDQRYAFLAKEQRNRGKLWDEALRGSGRFCDAGLSFDLSPDYCLMRRQHINRMLIKLFELAE